MLSPISGGKRNFGVGERGRLRLEFGKRGVGVTSREERAGQVGGGGAGEGAVCTGVLEGRGQSAVAGWGWGGERVYERVRDRVGWSGMRVHGSRRGRGDDLRTRSAGRPLEWSVWPHNFPLQASKFG